VWFLERVTEVGLFLLGTRSALGAGMGGPCRFAQLCRGGLFREAAQSWWEKPEWCNPQSPKIPRSSLDVLKNHLDVVLRDVI